MEKRRIECKISDSILRFKTVLNARENMQQEVHDLILSLQDNDSCLTEKDANLVTKILNAFLSLSFTIKANEKEVDKFIEYYD